MFPKSGERVIRSAVRPCGRAYRAMLFVVAALLVAGCGESTGPEDRLVKRVYQGPKWPADVEADPDVRSASYLGINQSDRREFPCVETAAEACSLANLVGFEVTGASRETDLYFEFDNHRAGYGLPLVRVLRRSYLASFALCPDFETRWTGPMFCLGPITHRPLTIAAVVRLLDHIWVFHNCTMYGATLLERQASETDSTFIITMREALLISGDWGLCDKIAPLTTTYVVDRESGHVEVGRVAAPTIRGRCPRSS